MLSGRRSRHSLRQRGEEHIQLKGGGQGVGRRQGRMDLANSKKLDRGERKRFQMQRKGRDTIAPSEESSLADERGSVNEVRTLWHRLACGRSSERRKRGDLAGGGADMYSASSGLRRARI